VHILNTPEDLEQVEAIERQPLWNNRKCDAGPFDIIGDVHGCYDELIELLEKLGYDITEPYRIAAPPGRTVVFLGDLVDRGPKVVEVINLVRSMMLQGIALCVPGNHDVKLLRKLRGKNVQLTHCLPRRCSSSSGSPPKTADTSPTSSTGSSHSTCCMAAGWSSRTRG
jgi:protein phosphatase